MGAATRRQPLAKTRKSGKSHFFEATNPGGKPAGMGKLLLFFAVGDQIVAAAHHQGSAYQVAQAGD